MNKRYTQVTLQDAVLLLDAEPARTPAGNPLAFPNKELAEVVAEEWRRQKHKDVMPLTHIAYVAIDLVATSRAAVTVDMLAYSDTDLVCYRAAHVPVLRERQENGLNPVIIWVERCFGITLITTDALMPVPQPEANRKKLEVAVASYDNWTLAALATATKLLGSVILALALIERYITAETAFQLSHLEEFYETERWGDDEEKEKKMQQIKQEVAAIESFLQMLTLS